MALSLADLLLSASYIIIAVTACGCVFKSYASAWFFAHFGWSITCTFHALGTYIVIFMSLDRFVGVWFPTWFKVLTEPPFDITKRLVLASVLCFGLHVLYMVDAEVQCDNLTLPINATDNCPSDSYISNDGFQKSFDEQWHTVYRYFYNLMVRWLPCAILIVLNFGLVLGVVKGRVKFPRVKEEVERKATKAAPGMKRQLKRNKQENVLVATAIAMTASYVVLTMPITIFLTGYAAASDSRCKEPSPRETLRHVGNIAQILEHVLHGVFLFFINPCFRQEMLCLLQCKKSPRDESLSSEPPLANGTRPLSSVSRSFSKVSRDSIVPSQPYKPALTETVEGHTLEEVKSLCRETLKEASENSVIISDS